MQGTVPRQANQLRLAEWLLLLSSNPCANKNSTFNKSKNLPYVFQNFVVVDEAQIRLPVTQFGVPPVEVNVEINVEGLKFGGTIPKLNFFLV